MQAINQPRPPEPSARPHPAYLPHSLRCLNCQVVPRSFHATFACQWRRYLYLLPLTHQDALRYRRHHLGIAESANSEQAMSNASAEVEWTSIAEAVDVMLGSLVGQELDFYAFGRSTPKGRSCVCNVSHASAKLAYLPRDPHAADTAGSDERGHADVGEHAPSGDLMESSEVASEGDQQAAPVLCIQLVSDRFVRRMARTLVATSVMSALWNEPLRLQRALDSRDRRDTAYPAPATGLCFTGAGYDSQAPAALQL